ncbi:hypothetical protein OB955_18495 [Halobacteria archaeon AArc-m2/3/4]|uniref:Uncharacterized protein n=1 Tax=Natronoglomus mannanivorans TaxID=2979990 RepID=A0AAP3E2U7_9EURY|nr:hypothetical protein [Halobacteria archaeon AArc-xg1-1]MCU4974712.1 hypothetical protein [Halobacteria archaeon AArc-m2/3/4]
MATATFERELETLVLEAFAKGARVDGTWEIESEPSTVPNWTIEIHRHSEQAIDETIFNDD